MVLNYTKYFREVRVSLSYFPSSVLRSELKEPQKLSARELDSSVRVSVLSPPVERTNAQWPEISKLCPKNIQHSWLLFQQIFDSNKSNFWNDIFTPYSCSISRIWIGILLQITYHTSEGVCFIFSCANFHFFRIFCTFIVSVQKSSIANFCFNVYFV